MTSTPERAEHSTDKLNEAIGPDVDISGAYPTGSAPTSTEAAEADSHPSEPTTTSRQGASLGDLTEDVSTTGVPQERWHGQPSVRRRGAQGE
jgi:hypothetical protein